MRPIDADALKEKLALLRMNDLTLYGSRGIREAIFEVCDAPTIDAEPVTGETSDGYHTFNELYHHRAVLFSVIVKAMQDKAWKSKKHHDGTMFDGMFIVGIETPDGQATYHYDIEPYWNMFDCKELENAPEWDGHTPAQAIERIGKLEPVRHGRWKLEVCTTVDCVSDECEDIPYIVCPFCGRREYDIDLSAFLDNDYDGMVADYPYCHCGAKMDGGAEE